MNCAKCRRPLTKPAAAHAGHLYGPVCARVLGIVTVITRPESLNRPAALPNPDQLDMFLITANARNEKQISEDVKELNAC